MMKKSGHNTYETLKKRIIAGHYVAGTQLKETHIAAEMGVSRTPVRAALNRLIQDGLATAKSGRGVFVASWTPWDIEDMVRLRVRLEPFAARLAAERASPEMISKLDRCNQQMEAAIETIKTGGDAIIEVQAANSAFHRLMVDAAGSARLKGMLGTLIDMPIITGSFFLYDLDDLRRSLLHHQDMVVALRLKNGDLAEQLMSAHLLISTERFMTQRRDYLPAADQAVQAPHDTNQENS